MRVAVVPFEFPVISETFVLNIAAGLIKRGHDVDILPLYGRPPKQGVNIHPLVHEYQLLDRTRYAPGIRMGNQNVSLPVAWRSLLFVGCKPYDIVHFQFGEAALKFLPLRRLKAFNKKWVVSFRGFDISSFVRKHGEDVYKDVFSACDLFLSNSEFFKQRLINLGSPEAKTFVYRSGIDCQKFHFVSRMFELGQPLRIATVGRLTEKKGIQYAVRAVAQLIKQGVDIRYSIVGDGPLFSEIQNLIVELQMQDRINLCGALDQKGVIEILNQAHIFVTSSVTASDGDQNGPDNTIKEAMAMGLPVIASRTAAIPEVVEDGKTGFLVDERDVQGIVNKIQYLFEHPQHWTQITRTARAFIEENYNIEKLNDQLVEHYQRICADF